MSATRQASLSPTISQSLPKFMSIASVMPSSHLILWRPLLLCPQSFPASGTSPMSQLFQSDDQNTGASAPASVLPISIQGLFPLKLTGLILLSKGLWSVFSSTTVWMHYFFCASLSLLSSSQTIHDPWEDYSLDYTDVCWQSNVSAFQNTSRFVKAFLPRSKYLLISWLQSPSAVISEPKKRKSVTTSTFFSFICHEVIGLDAMNLVFLIVLSWLFHSLPSPSSRGSLVPLRFLPLEWYHLHIWGCWCFSCLSWFQLVTHPAWHFSWCAQCIG